MLGLRFFRALWRWWLPALGLVAVGGPLWGQDWFEIEVLIFEHIEAAEGEAEGEAEQWPTELDLRWPAPILRLQRGGADETAVLPFHILPAAQRRLNDAAYALRRRSDYRLLWHRAWRAPLLEREGAPWIRVQAGEAIGEHFRLEGGVRVHLARYLHLHSDLWLTEVASEAIVGAEDGLGAEGGGEAAGRDLGRDLDSDADPDSVAAGGLAAEFESGFSWGQLPEPGPVPWGCNFVREEWPAAARLIPDEYYENPAPAAWYYPFGCAVPSDLAEDMPFSIALPLTETAGRAADEALSTPPPVVRYPVAEIVRIADQRRMRAGEVHYIDHPRVGILAVIHPIEQPDIEGAEGGAGGDPAGAGD